MSSATKVEDIPLIVSKLRNNYNTEVTYSYEWRVKQLTALQKMLTERKEDLSKALYNDLHRSRFETDMLEIGVILHEIQHVLDNLADWMKPEKKSTNMLNLPGSSEVHHNPLGVVLIMAPWNYPIMLVFSPLVGALAAGNVCLIRPAAYTTSVSSTIKDIVAEYFESDVVTVVTGEREVTSAVLKERFDTIFFTGGPTLGKIVYTAAAEHLTPVILELGGKSPAIVDKTADIPVVAKRLTWAAFVNAGQTCVRPDYVMVHEDVADALIKAMKDAARDFYCLGDDEKEFQNVTNKEVFGKLSDVKVDEQADDNGWNNTLMQKSPYLCRLVNGGGAFKRIQAIVEHDKQYIVAGGNVDEADNYVQPTILDFKSDFAAFASSKAMSAEIFGPILPVVRVANMSRAVDYVRENDKPLSLYLYASNSKLEEEVFTRTTSGSMAINDSIVHLSNAHLPFGGVGHSGMGNYHGYYSFLTFSHARAVLKKMTAFDVPARYPPYTKTKQSIMNIVSTPLSKRVTSVLTIGGIVVAVAGLCVLAKEFILPPALPHIISFLQNLNSKL